ncbi:sulfurtransferase TusA family protein [Isoalcanivorax beigongshangi]|uniref:Sulfurtransferase TusA family protein n=1 Tax=Isoalcanivorax beigongshangi TaxID=3238810 RepID=A0ABV4AHT0_9GAMM
MPELRLRDAQRVDACGLRCPLPLLKLRQALRHAPAGTELWLSADDAGAQRDVPAYLRQSPHQLVRDWHDGAAWHFLVLAAGEA